MGGLVSDTEPKELRYGPVTTINGTIDVDLIITNETVYLNYEGKPNGLKTKKVPDGDGNFVDTGEGMFGFVNAIGPATNRDTGVSQDATFVELKIAFVKSGTNEEITLPRTFLSMYDFDGTAHPVRECLSANGPSRMILSEQNELEVFRTAEQRQESVVKDIDDVITSQGLPLWPQPWVCSTVKGTGKDNPSDPNKLTDVQRGRSVMVMLEGKSFFKVRLGLSGCCTTGRNFLFVGCSLTWTNFTDTASPPPAYQPNPPPAPGVTSAPTASPTVAPTAAPTVEATVPPTASPTAAPTGMDQADTSAILSTHNSKRATHCACDLTWDASLAAKAQAWADTCPTAHTPLCATEATPSAHCRGTKPTTLAGSVGENMAWGGLTATTATTNWYDEYTSPGYSFADSADGGSSGAPGGNTGTGHFTQVVWKDTTKLGCGVKKDCDYRTFFNTAGSWAASTSVWVCMYQQAGNWVMAGQYENNVLDPAACTNTCA